jgi:undecaprenyl-diphosphatase
LVKNRNPGDIPVRLSRDLVVALAALVLLAALTNAVMQGRAAAFDAAVRNGVHAASFPALTYAMRGVSDLGEAVFLVALGVIVAWRLVSLGQRHHAVFFVIATLGAELIDQALKFWIERPRPEAFFGPQPLGYSFPSGHAFVSCCFYLAVAEILIDDQRWLDMKLAVWALAILLTGLIGLSRVYLGVHYPTDVFGGYAAAIAWLSMVRAGQKLRARREVRRPQL